METKKILLKKYEIVAIVNVVPHIFDFDNFQTLSGFEFGEVREVIDKINDILFTYEYMIEEEFEFELDKKELAILAQIVGQSLYLVKWKENLFFRSENLDLEKIDKVFETQKDFIKSFYSVK